MVHLSGYVTCDRRKFSYWSFWGCGKRPAVRDQVGVVITNFRDVILTPQRPFLKNDPGKFSLLPGFKSSSSKIILPPFFFTSWYRAKSCDCGMVRIWQTTLKPTMEDGSAVMFTLSITGWYKSCQDCR